MLHTLKQMQGVFCLYRLQSYRLFLVLCGKRCAEYSLTESAITSTYTCQRLVEPVRSRQYNVFGSQWFSPELDRPVVPVYLKLIALVLLSFLAFIVGAAFWWRVRDGVESSPITCPLTGVAPLQLNAEQGSGAAAHGTAHLVSVLVVSSCIAHLSRVRTVCRVSTGGTACPAGEKGRAE